MVVTSKLRRHKVMERAMRALMGNNLPPRFKFKDTYDSIEVPTAYQQHLPSQATLEAKFDELIAEEETEAPTTEIKADMTVSSNLEVGTSNLFVDTETGNVGIGTDAPTYTLDVHGTANVGALTATSAFQAGAPVSVRWDYSDSTPFPQNPTSAKYYKVASLGTTSSNSNAGRLRISGTIGGFTAETTSLIDCYVSSRGGLEYGGSMIGMGTSFTTTRCDILVYKQTDDTYDVYLKTDDYFTFDLTISGAILDTYLTKVVYPCPTTDTSVSTPVGTLEGSVVDACSFVMTDAGNVGIGTVNPIRVLDSRSGDGSSSAGWISGAFGPVTGLSTNPRVVVGTLSNVAVVGSHRGDLNAWTDLYLNNPTNPVVVKTNGNVGIGTTSPDDILETFDNVGRVKITRNANNNNFGCALDFALYNNASEKITYARVGGSIQDNTDGSEDGFLSFQVRTAGVLNDNYGQDKMRITSAGNVGIGETSPQYKLTVVGDVSVRSSLSTGRNLAREFGTVIAYSSQYQSARGAANIINGAKNFENGSNDWITASGQRTNAYVVIDLGAAYTVDRMVVYNQNEYSNSRREVKGFTLTASSDNSTWVTILTSECGRSNAHEPNPGWSFRIPSDWDDDNEGRTFRYWKFTMNTFHGTDSYGGITELELYASNEAIQGEVSSSSIVAQDVYTETGNFSRGLTVGKGYGGTSTGDGNVIIEGSVGIGTADPQDLFHIYGASDSTLRVETDTGQAGILLRAGATTRRACRIDFSRADTGTQYAWIIGDYQQNATDDLTLGTSGGGRIMTLTQGGNVGIGKTNPSVALDVNGAIKTSTTSTNIVTGSGSDVTINSTTPTTFASVAITTRGNKVLVICSGDLQPSNGTGDWLNMKFYRGTTAIGKNHRYHMGTAGSTNQVFAMHVIDQPSAGTYTYYAKGYNGSGSTFFGEDDNPQITAIEFL